MSELHSYQVNLNWLKDRKGILESNVLDSKIEVVTPPEFPSGITGIWSPEHLFVAAVNSCFMTTFLAIAENSKLDFISFKCNAIGILDKVEGKYCVSEITISPLLTIGKEIDSAKGMQVLEMSEKACLISNSIKSKIIMDAEISVMRQ